MLDVLKGKTEKEIIDGLKKLEGKLVNQSDNNGYSKIVKVDDDGQVHYISLGSEIPNGVKPWTWHCPYQQFLDWHDPKEVSKHAAKCNLEVILKFIKTSLENLDKI